MHVENVQVITLDEQDLKKATVNSGLRVPLPPGTTHVVIRLSASGQLAGVPDGAE